MKKKNLLVGLLVAASALSLAGCKKTNKPATNPTDTPTTVAPTTTPSVKPTTGPVVKPTDNDSEIAEMVQAALDAIEINANYTADFDLEIEGNGGVVIAWTSDNTAITVDGDKAKVKRPGFTAADVEVTLTATAVFDEVVLTKEFKTTILKLADESIAISEVKAKEKGTQCAIRGVVSGFAYVTSSDANKRTGVYITDQTGTIYVYGDETAAAVEKGDEVYITGAYDVYFGLPQLKNPTVEVISHDNVPQFLAVDATKTVSEILDVTLPTAQTKDDTIIQGTVFEFNALLKKTGTTTYVNYNLYDLEDSSKYLAQYFSKSPSPSETYEYTDWLNKYDGQVVKIRYIVAGTNAQYAKWRGHILSIDELDDAGKAEVEANNIVKQLTKPALNEAYDINLSTTYPEAKVEITYDANDVVAYNAEAGKVTVTPVAANAETPIIVKITIGESVVTKTMTIVTAPRVWKVNDPIDTIVADKAYTAFLVQKNLDNKKLYLTGEVSNNYLVTTEDPEKAIMLAAQAVDGSVGEYYLYYTDANGTKKYINGVVSTKYVNLKVEDTATTVWTYDSEYHTFVTLQTTSEGESKFYIGAYDKKTTLGTSKTSYLSDLNSNFQLVIYEQTTLNFDPETTKFEVTFNTNGGSEITKQEVLYGKTIEEVADPVYAGKNFAGWYANETLTIPFTATTKITADTVIYAKWADSAVYNVTFVGGGEIDSQPVVEGENATSPEVALEKTFYVFAGWCTDEECTTPFNFETAITSDITLYAKWVDADFETYDSYMAKSNGDTVLVKGYIALKGSTKDTFITDGAGNCFYIYGANDDIAAAEVGTEIKVKGMISVYKNLYEVVPAEIEVTANTSANIQPTDITADITANGLTTTKANQNKYVKFTGVLTGTSAVTVGTNKVAIFPKNCTINPAVGSTVEVVGIVSIFDTTTQVIVWSSDAVIDKTNDETKAQMLLDSILGQMPKSTVAKASEITIKTQAGAIVTVTPAASQEIVTYADGKLAINPTEEETTVTVTVSVQIGGAIKTGTADITAAAPSDAGGGSETETITKTINMAADTGFSSWTSSYVVHEEEIDGVSIKLNGNKQSSTITDCPVSKGGIPLEISVADADIQSVTVVFKQWTTKAKKVTISYSIDGGATYVALSSDQIDCFTEGGVTADLSAVGETVTHVKYTFTETSNQVGIVSIDITYEQ